MSHRLFVGLRPSEPLRETLLGCMGGIDNARWQNDGQLHLTLRYMGDVERNMANDLAEELARVEGPAFDVEIADTGVFERKGMPHTLWAGVKANEALLRLQRRVEQACQAVGLAAETRKFHPHITLARLNASCGCIRPFLSETVGRRFGQWLAEEFILYESHLRQEGSLYEPIVRYPLRAPV